MIQLEYFFLQPIGASVFLFIWNGYRLRNGTYLFHGYYHTDSPYPPFQTVEILSYLLLGTLIIFSELMNNQI